MYRTARVGRIPGELGRQETGPVDVPADDLRDDGLFLDRVESQTGYASLCDHAQFGVDISGYGRQPTARQARADPARHGRLAAELRDELVHVRRHEPGRDEYRMDERDGARRGTRARQ